MSCDALIKAIDAFIAKENNDLSDSLDEAGYVDSDDIVERIEALEVKVAEALQLEVLYFQKKLKDVVDLESFAKNFPGIAESDKTDEILAQIFLDDFKENIPNLADAYIKQLSPDMTVSEISRRTTDWIESWSTELGQKMKLTSHNEIEKILIDNISEGKGVDELTRQLMDGGIREDYYRARRTAVTETLRAHSVSQQEAIMQNPATDRKEWVHTGSYRNTPRENHAAMSGTIVPKEEPFNLLGADGVTYYPMYPHDTNLPAGESINCKCFHRPISNDEVMGMSLSERRRLQEEAIAEMDDAWVKELDAKNKAKAGIDI